MPNPLLLIAAFLALGLTAFENLQSEESIDFARTIGPMLAKRCSGCHNEAEHKGGLDLTRRETMLTGGESGAAIEPTKPNDSLLWRRIAADEMPPKQPLAETEKNLLRDWIASGAKWTGAALDPLQFTSDSRAGFDWWSLQSLSPVVPPAVTTARTSIDAFVHARLAEAKLPPSPPGDRRTLIRRVTMDLLGLPPSPEAVAEFVADDSPVAYERLVDRLLATPAYGERWARHWLDVARFGESQGFERDKLRTNSWRYRDWVIDAFNQDMPYDEFARRQLAGDVLFPGDAAALVATGFLVASPWDEVGQKQQSAAMRAVVRQDEIEDLVGTVAQTFLGLTVNCSRCHDHKFDPVRQAEYYRMAAALAGVQHGEPAMNGDSLAQASTQLAARLAARIRIVESRLAGIEDPVREQILAARKTRPVTIPAPQPIAAWEFNADARDTIGELHVELKAGAKLHDGRLVLDGKGYAITPPLRRELREKTLEAWITLADLSQQGGGVVTVETLDGSTFDAIVFGEREPKRWMAGSNGFERSQSLQGAEESEVQRRPVQIAIAYHADGQIVAYRDGVSYGQGSKSNGPVTFVAEKSRIAFGLRHSPPGGNKFLRGGIDRARLYDRALSAEEVAAIAGTISSDVSETELAAALSEDRRAEQARLRFELEQLRDQRVRVVDTKVYAVDAKTPDATFVLLRGNPAQPVAAVSAGAVAAVRGVDGDFKLANDASDVDRRRRFAEWLTSPLNPLFPRVVVNRLWHYHFGVGIVETPNDFGFNGGRPSHPELLDWLATELVQSGWSVKHVQRLIVTSATYRQSSQFRAAAAQVDGANRLLWRKSPQRLEAETLRDALLVIAGALDGGMHGPGFYDFTTFVHNSQFYEMRDPLGASFHRRSLYRTWVRSGRSQFLDVFDCPDPSTKTPQRAVTTTPLQALALLNNSFVLRMADRCAARIGREAGDDPTAQIQRLFQLTFGRGPAESELAECGLIVREHDLATLCRVLFNSNELVFVD